MTKNDNKPNKDKLDKGSVQPHPNFEFNIAKSQYGMEASSDETLSSNDIGVIKVRQLIEEAEETLAKQNSIQK